MYKHKRSLILVVVVLMVIVGGVYIYKNREVSNIKEISQKQNMPTTDIKMSKYKSKHGFVIEYPTGWRYYSTIDTFSSIEEAQKSFGNSFSIFSYPENSSNPGFPVSNDKLKMDVYVYDNITQVSLDGWISTFKLKNILSEEEIIIGGKVAKKISYSGEEGGKSLSVFYLDGNKGAWFIVWPPETKFSKEFETIVKTFKFTN